MVKDDMYVGRCSWNQERLKINDLLPTGRFDEGLRRWTCVLYFVRAGVPAPGIRMRWWMGRFKAGRRSSFG
jgi:hypothetical protein